MPGGGIVAVTGTTDVNRVEAPVTVRAYLIVAFAAFGGIFFGYDTGWMGGVLNMDYFIKQYTGAEYPDVVYPGLDSTSQTIKDYRNSHFVVVPWQQSLVTSILSAGTFFGAIMAGDIADFIGRRITIITGCGIFVVGGILETASTGLGVMVAGRLIAGFGVGFISSIVILYMSEIAPKKVRGAVVAGYQFCITIGILLANCVVYATQNRRDTGSYRIPIAVQFLWAIILAIGLALLPESPRYWVKKGKLDKAASALGRVRVHLLFPTCRCETDKPITLIHTLVSPLKSYWRIAIYSQDIIRRIAGGVILKTMALESPQPLSRKKSLFRRFSRRDRGDAPPSPFLMNEGLRSYSPSLQSPNPQSPRRLQRRPSHAPSYLLTPPPSPANKSTVIAIDASKPQQPKMVAHIQRIELPSNRHVRSEFTPPPSPEPRRRVLPSALPTMPFPGKPLITSWNIFLPPSQIYSLYLGYAPKDMDDKWYIYSEGPDQTGKLKVHFHRSWTGLKVAELFVVMDTKGEGAGKIVGIKWNGDEEMNWMSEEEAKYMIRTACRWQLAVDLEK